MVLSRGGREGVLDQAAESGFGRMARRKAQNEVGGGGLVRQKGREGIKGRADGVTQRDG